MQNTRQFLKQLDKLSSKKDLVEFWSDNQFFLKNLKTRSLSEFKLLHESVAQAFSNAGNIAPVLPKTEDDVNSIVNSLKSGIKAGTAGEKLFNKMGDKGLFDLVNVLKSQAPDVNIAEPVVNYIATMDSPAPIVESLKLKILNCDILSSYILPIPDKLFENTVVNQVINAQPQTKPNPNISSVSRALHGDLEALKRSNKVDQAEKLKKLTSRAAQFKVNPQELEQDYKKQFKQNSLLDNVAITESWGDKLSYDLKFDGDYKLADLLELAAKIFGVSQKYVDFKNTLERKFGKEFASAFTFLMHDELPGSDEYGSRANDGAQLYWIRKTKHRLFNGYDFVSDYIKNFDEVKKLVMNRGQVTEDVIPFPGNNNPKIAHSTPAEIHQLPKADQLDRIEDVVAKAKKLIDQTDLSNPDRQFTIMNSIKHWCKNNKITFDEFLDEFYTMFDIEYYKYYHDKAYNDHVENIAGSINESIKCETAKQCRSALWYFLKKFVDTSNIMLFSNFESFEDKDEIVLRIGLYDDNAKKLNQTKEEILHALIDEGFARKKSDSGTISFTKDEIVLIISDVKKTFRSGPYKNREVPSIIVEIHGPKKVTVDSSGEELMEVSKRTPCTKCDGTGQWKAKFGSASGRCFKCNGKGWVTPQNVINNAAAMRLRDQKVYAEPRQYKD